MTACLAHVRRNEGGSFAIHDLEVHLRTVGDVAEATRSCVGRHAAESESRGFHRAKRDCRFANEYSNITVTLYDV